MDPRDGIKEEIQSGISFCSGTREATGYDERDVLPKEGESGVFPIFTFYTKQC